jgi:hypothetical protein
MKKCGEAMFLAGMLAVGLIVYPDAMRIFFPRMDNFGKDLILSLGIVSLLAGIGVRYLASRAEPK